MMTEALRPLAEALPPGVMLILGALLVPLLRGALRQGFMLALPVLGLLQLHLLPDGYTSSVHFFSYDLPYRLTSQQEDGAGLTQPCPKGKHRQFHFH